MRVPSSIYRLQLTENFTLKEAAKLLPYLKEMGIDGVYCSPYFEAFSPHGYDVTNPNKINPALASEKQYNAFCRALKKYRLFHIADVVPNHMGIKGNNEWFQDVLKKGPKSKYASFFDIDWSKDKILIPILGESYDEAIKNKTLKKTKNGFTYGGQTFPLSNHYRLVNWKMSAQETTYRRFFNINELIGLRIEDKKVLKAHHKLVFKLLKKKKIDGLRIDHPDGLYDPDEYFHRLREKHKGLIVVEKILGWQEELPPSWKVEGTVGYEFANLLTGVFVKQSKKLTQIYEKFTDESTDFEQILYEKKKFYMATEMAGDVKDLANHLHLFSSKLRPYVDLPKGELLAALYELLAAFPVYRSYIRPKGKVPERDKPYLKEAFEKARNANREIGHRAFDLLEEIFFLKIDVPYTRDFIMRFQQLSAPIMAKGFEDITLYNYNRLLALNEVGGDPERGCVTMEEFHHFCKRKQEKWPYGFLATSTHDTKRSQDVRMQIALLSEMSTRFGKILQTWARYNHKHKINGFPEPNMEYFLYQTLLGIWPEKPSFTRLWPVFQKSLREARKYTSWRHPDLKYEKVCEKFLRAILKKGNPFLKSFEVFQKELVEFGQWNSLSAIAIRLGCPGIVDVYEGCENWRYTLVDPDNRRPVNYSRQETIKTELHKVALNFRKKHKSLFLEGKYIPLEVVGPKKDHVIAYMRRHKNKALVVAGARFFTTLKGFGSTEIVMPKKMKKGIQLFTGEIFSGKILPVSELFTEAPFAWVDFSSK